MRTFVLMSKLCPQSPRLAEMMSGAKTGRSRRVWMKKVRETCPKVKFLASYALLGGWDFMDIYEAPDEETAAKVSMICSASCDYMVESWTAIPEKNLERLAREVMEGIS
ncbi:MAG TPA: GYD domain-containing protein [candidate division Zixibacteria bacterium]|nr:GYD domain-containing protein [candidate division Zixibacteria bacterium]